MNLETRTIWITWHDHQRTRSLVECLSVPVFVYDDHRTLPRYTIGPLWTLWVLMRERPNVVFCHFSYGLQLVISLYKYFFRFGRVRVISDCHNKALKREVSGALARVFLWFKSLVFKGVDLVIVTNASLVPIAQKLCREVAVLRDPLANWHGADVEARDHNGADGGHVLFVCSFDKDEPLDLIFDAAMLITRNLDRTVIITGKIPVNRVHESVLSNRKIRLPGFMPLHEYRAALFLAAAVVVLTEDDDCLVCGAYESLGASRPTVLSATSGLKACFGESAVYAEHTPADIVRQVSAAVLSQSAAADCRLAFQSAWNDEWEAFRRTLVKIIA